MRRTCIGDDENMYDILVVRPEGRRPSGRRGMERKALLKWILNNFLSTFLTFKAKRSAM